MRPRCKHAGVIHGYSDRLGAVQRIYHDFYAVCQIDVILHLAVGSIGILGDRRCPGQRKHAAGGHSYGASAFGAGRIATDHGGASHGDRAVAHIDTAALTAIVAADLTAGHRKTAFAYGYASARIFTGIIADLSVGHGCCGAAGGVLNTEGASVGFRSVVAHGSAVQGKGTAADICAAALISGMVSANRAALYGECTV